MDIYIADWGIKEIGEDGYYTRLVYFLKVTTPYGREYSHFKIFYTFEKANKALDSVLKRKAKDWTPENNENWTYTGIAYGSRAHEDNYEEAESALRRFD